MTVCSVKRQHPEISTKELSAMFKLDRSTISKYLKKGHGLGLCYYDKDEEYRRENDKKNATLKRKQVEVFKDGVSQGIFESVKFLSDNSEEILGVKIAKSSIREVCIGRKKKCKGCAFRYVEEGGEIECQAV